MQDVGSGTGKNKGSRDAFFKSVTFSNLSIFRTPCHTHDANTVIKDVCLACVYIENNTIKKFPSGIEKPDLCETALRGHLFSAFSLFTFN